MGSNCCRPKDQSPKISLSKLFSRWSHRISPTTDIVKIADAEEDGYTNIKRKDSISDPVFEITENEDRNHVTMLLPDAPPIPPRKKTRIGNKRVSFQSDVEIMRTASSKSLDRFTVTVIQEEPKARSKSFDSYFDQKSTSPRPENLNKRRTSSLEHLAVDEIQSMPSLINKLRRDTLGDALDFQSYKRPLVIPKPEGPLIEEESEGSSSEMEEEIPSSFKLAAKLRRDTLGDALLLASKSKKQPETPVSSSNEDLEETVKHSRLCSKLRRDTFGDALRQAVHCKACSSLEDITELEVPLPATPEEDEEELSITDEHECSKIPDEVNGTPTIFKEEKINVAKSTSNWSAMNSVTRCKTCMLLEVQSQETGQCKVCSSTENITDLTKPSSHDSRVDNSSSQDDKVTETDGKRHLDISLNSPVKQLLLTDEDITSTLEKIRSTGKIEPKEPYNLVYSSHMKGPFASSKESINKDESGKSSSTDSLNVTSIAKEDVLTPNKNRNELVT